MSDQAPAAYLAATFLGVTLPLTLGGIIIWLLANPNAAATASQYFWRILSSVFGAATRRYAAASVQAEATQFLNKHVLSRVSEATAVTLEVQWVESADDARRLENGQIVVRMRRDRDQTRNVVAAVRATIPQVLFPAARPYLDARLSNAVDLELLRILSDLLGEHAATLFHTEILAHQTASDPELLDLLRVMDSVNSAGLFETVLLTEFARLGRRVLRDPPRTDLRDEAYLFVEYLAHLATREPGDESQPLEFSGRYFRVGFILASKSVTAARGTSPYERALGVKLAKGIDSIYLLGLTPDQAAICSKIEQRFDEDARIRKLKHLSLLVRRHGDHFRVPMAHYERNELHLPPGTFADRLAELDIHPGSIVRGVIRDVDARHAVVDVDGLDGELHASEIAWGYAGPVNTWVSAVQEIECQVHEIRGDRGLLRLSLKRLIPSPWEGRTAPAVGTHQRFRVHHIADGELSLSLVDRTSGESFMFGRMKLDDWSWHPFNDSDNPAPVVGDEGEGLVVVANHEADEIVLSRRECTCPDFATAMVKYPKGRSLRAKVVKVEYDGFVLEVEPGVLGRIDRFEIRKYGHELADFQQTVVVGQSFDVVVSGAKKNRRFLSLRLAREP